MNKIMFKNTYDITSKKTFRVLIAFIVVMSLVVAVAAYIKIKYEITSVAVIGNDHYSKQEIEEIVFDKPYTYNSIFLYLKYHNKSINNVPFVEKMDVDIVNPNLVRINVYEKKVAGYIEYLGRYMYFDKDGIVVESSSEEMEDIPFVTGLKFDHVVLHEPLPVADKQIFLLILNITQLLNKYDIRTDRIAFDSEENITLHFGDARVSLGDDSYIDEKINEMHWILPELEGYAGILHMENYSGEESNFSFDKDKKLDEYVEELEAESNENLDVEAEE